MKVLPVPELHKYPVPQLVSFLISGRAITPCTIDDSDLRLGLVTKASPHSVVIETIDELPTDPAAPAPIVRRFQFTIPIVDENDSTYPTMTVAVWELNEMTRAQYLISLAQRPSEECAS